MSLRHIDCGKTIQVQIEAYGAIERLIPPDLNFECHVDTSISEVLAMMIRGDEKIAPLLDRCACAIGEDIVSRELRLQQNTHLVLLAPVAGG